MTDMKTHVETLIKRAADAPDYDAAMKYAQAALNAANALCSLQALIEAKGK